MGPHPLFLFQLVWFLLVWALIARLAVWPWTARLSPSRALRAWIAPQMFRVLGVGLLVPQLSPGMPRSFAVTTAAGDSLTALLAAVCFVALSRESASGRALAWLTTGLGSLDLAAALVHAARVNAASHLEAQWYVATLGVPLMLVAHAGALATLLRSRPGRHTPQHD